jgi:hypothetical protein
MLSKFLAACVLAVATLVSPVGAAAQGLDALGSRAAALGAFVAVADDASAVAWNPSGLVSGPFFNISVDLGRATDQPDGTPAPGFGAGRHNATLISIGTTPLGLAYYRLSATSIQGVTPAVLDPADRQQEQVIVRTVVTSHLGATVQQSVGDYLTVGATLKLVRGTVGQGTVVAGSWDEAFDRAEALSTSGSTRGDVDAGAMVSAGRARVGLVVRNLTAPRFADEEGETATLRRHARIGVAWGDRWPGVPRLIVALDADLTRVSYPAGERRDVAAGVERWLRGQRIGVRGGVRASTVGEVRPVVSGGVSYAVRAGAYVDGFVTRGRRDARGWGVGMRLTY